MNSVKQLAESKHKLFRLLLFAGLLALLAACSTNTLPPDTQPEDAITSLATLDIAADITEADLLAAYGGEIVSFKPEAGFAVLGFKAGEGELSTLSTTANLDAISAPVTAAGSMAWAGGHSAWAGGHSAWAGGHSAWAGGHSAWAGGLPAATTVGGNLHDFDRINLPEGQLRAPRLGEGVVVAVIDTGVSLNHPAIKDNLVPAADRYDFIDKDGHPLDQWNSGPNNDAFGHGTAVAGLVLQVAPAARILPLRVLDSSGFGDTDDIVRAVEWAVDKGADVINLSVGSALPDPALQAMVKYAGNQGVFVVASAGNEGQEGMTYPARWGWDPNMGNFLLGVVSRDPDGRKSSFSNYGEGAEAWAPGENLLSAYGNGQDGKPFQTAGVTGTSFAAPLVAGSLALALGENPDVAYRTEYHHNLKIAAKDAKWNLDVDGYLAMMGLEAPTPARGATFVVGDPANLSPTDTFFANRLKNLGFAVKLVDDNGVSTSDAAGADLVVISSSVISRNVGTTFRDSPVPVLTWESLVYDEMGMSVGSTNVSYTSEGVRLTGHDLVGGEDGDVVMLSTAQTIDFGTPSAGAQILSVLPDGKATTFVYEQGSKMYGLNAPAKRAGVFFDFRPSTSAKVLTPSAAALFDTLVVWSVMDDAALAGGN